MPGMDLDVRELLTDTIKRYLDRYCDENGFDPVWGDPLVGFADARSLLFQELRTVVHPDHLMPEDILPGATIVVSYYIPYDRELAKGNISGNTASTEWAFAYALTTSIIDDLADTVATDVRALDFEAEFPTPEQYGRIEGDIVSRWSQRHVAYIAGLGAFGKNNMLITDRGCCGRFYSVVTNLDVEPDVPVDFLYLNNYRDVELTRKAFRVCAGRTAPRSLFVVNGIGYSKEMRRLWKEMRSDERVGVTFDLYDAGLLFFDKTKVKQHYIVNF